MRDPEQAQHGLGKLIDGGLLVNARGVAPAHPQQPEQAAGHRAERDLGIRDGEPARSLPSLDITQGARRQAARDVQGVQACAGEDPGDVGIGPAEPARRSVSHGEQLRRVADAGDGAVDHLPQRSSTSSEAVWNNCSLLSKWL